MLRFSLLLAIGVGTHAFSVTPPQPPLCLSRGQRLGAPAMFEIDGNMVIGTVGLFGTAAVGVALVAFVEKQGQKSGDSMSDETRSRLASKFMEDEELAVSYDDTIAVMEAALAKAEGREVIEGDGLTEEEKAKIDTRGWGD